MSREKQDMGTVNTVRESDANIPGHRKKKKKKKRLQGQAPKSHSGSVCLSNTEDLVPSSLDLTNGQHSVHTPF